MPQTIELIDASELLTDLRKKTEGYWVNRGEEKVLNLFLEMSERVPAYKDFLRKNKLSPSKVKKIQDLKLVPTIDKKNYLRQYPLELLCWDGQFNEKQWVISTTSGSTGEPFYFPRQESQNLQYALVAELYLLTNFQIDKKSTLYIVGFPMGAWIGGLFTYEAIKTVAERGKYKMSIITPGIHKHEIIKAVKALGGNFNQIIIGSYGPFLKDTLDDGERYGVDWKKYNLRFIFSAEAFTEEFRDYVLEKAGLSDPYTTTLNHYGTVDFGTMSYETPIAILIRRLAIDNKDLYKELFGDIYKLPTLTQYIPELFYFEISDGNLFCSAYSGLPLVRYDLKDRGGILTWGQVVDVFKKHGKDLGVEARKAGISDTVWELPFVYVYERSDFSVSLYAFEIYPETIRRALQKKKLENKLTGKFTMMVKFDNDQNQYLEINVELKNGIKMVEKLSNQVQDLITQQLLQESSEYRETFKEKDDKIAPKIIFWGYEDPLFFQPGVKQKWVKK